MNLALIIPWILLIVTIGLLFVSNNVKRNILLTLLGMQILLCLIALVLAATYLSSSTDDKIAVIVHSFAIITSIALLFVSIWRRWDLARETIFGN